MRKGFFSFDFFLRDFNMVDSDNVLIKDNAYH